jgi:adenosylcobinamide kinase/adenosylcobinamide-phosphate guanylyltransferase
MANITLITGGARSGKSTQALELAAKFPRKAFVATGEGRDQEMAERIEFHRTTRPPDFQTIEEPIEIALALEKLASSADAVVLDCLTLWISNLMHSGATDARILSETDRVANVLRAASFASVIVTDEVGSGIVPEHPMSRRFRDLLGWTNQKIATIADEVLLMVAGYPIKAK